VSTWQKVANELDELFVAVAEAREKLVAVPEEAGDVARELSKLLSRLVAKLAVASRESASSEAPAVPPAPEAPAKKKEAVSPPAQVTEDNGELPYPPSQCDPVRY